MRRLQTGYAGSFNRRHRRVGHLFQNRYKSILVVVEPYFLELVRYLHQNPVRARLVKTLRKLDAYPWSGYAVLLGNREAAWQDVGYVLEQFAVDETRARRAYRQFVAEGLRQGRRPELSVRSVGGRDRLAKFRRGRERRMSDERVLGSGEFVEKLLEEMGSRPLEPRRIRSEERERFLSRLASKISRDFGLREVKERGLDIDR